MCLLIQLLFVIFLSNDTVGELLKDYDGYKIYGISRASGHKSNILKEYIGVTGFDFFLSSQHNYTNLMVIPEYQKHFEKRMLNNNIDYKIINENVGKSVLNEYEQRMKAVTRSFDMGEYDFSYFPRYYEIFEFMNQLVNNRRYSKIIQIGKSFQKKPIYAMKIQKFSNKPVFVIDAGIHAREWASHVSALYIMQKVVKNEDKFVDKMSFIIIPCLNPDGYEYSHKNDRFWRKSRSLQKSSKCLGVDLNRNFDSHWGEFKEEKDLCAETYAGPRPFSEPESIALRNLLLLNNPYAYITLHTFGALILYPWGFKKDLPSNWQTLHSIALAAAETVKNRNGTNYIVGSAARILYESSGGSDDWAMEKAGIPIVYTIELPEYQHELFILPPEKIKPVVRETYAIFITLVDKIQKEIKK